ncbi:MAG: hypothetical protein Q9166_005911 [cf. Caloplaca sp. 2 TL-2023]
MATKRKASGKDKSNKRRIVPIREDPGESAALAIDGLTSVINEDGFESEIFKILVGPEEKKFTAHASFLRKSPVLNRMCNGEFVESRTFCIRLPEDDPAVIRAVIQYLYTGDFQDFGSVAGNPAQGSDVAARQLADIYGVAEMYQLNDLKTLIIKKLGDVVDVVQRPFEFFDAAKRIYDVTPDSDHGWRTFFKDAAAKLPQPKAMPKVLYREFNENIGHGGIMAVDMVTALCAKFNEHIKDEQSYSSRCEELVSVKNREIRLLEIDKVRHEKEYEQLKKSLTPTYPL